MMSLIDKLEYAQITKTLDMSDTIAIFMHINPDGDTVGSALALYKYLINSKKIVDVFLEEGESISVNLKTLPNANVINGAIARQSYDLGIALDCASPSRVGKKNLRFLETRCAKTISIDHHKSHTKFTDILLLDANAVSTTELLYKFMLLNNSTLIDKDVATCLYVGIVTDTGNFSYGVKNHKTMEIVAELLKYNIDMSTIIRKAYLETSVNAFNLLVRALSSIIFTYDNKIALIVLEEKDFRELNAVLSDTEGIINHVINIRDVILAISIVEVSENIFKVGLRSKGNVDSSLIAKHFGGGGHKNASGCQIAGNKKYVIDKLFSVSKSFLLKND